MCMFDLEISTDRKQDIMSQAPKIDINHPFSHLMGAQTKDITSPRILQQNKQPVFTPAPQLNSTVAEVFTEAELPFDLVGAAV